MIGVFPLLFRCFDTAKGGWKGILAVSAATMVSAAACIWSTALQAADNVDLDIHGSGEKVENNIRDHLDLEKLPCTIDEVYLDNAIAEADSAVADALHALGYYRATWRFSHTRNQREKCWEVTLDVTPGERVKVTEVSVEIAGEGADDPEFRDVLSSLPLKQGQKLDHGKYEQSKRAIQQRATSLGYFSGKYIKNVLRIDTVANTASAVLQFDSGPRYHFGTVSYPESLPLDKAFLRRYQTFEPGDPYSSAKLIAFQNSLISSHYFDDVSVNQMEPDDETREVNVSLDFKFKSKYLSTFGVGFSTDIGPRVSYELKNRRFNEDGDTYRITSQWSPVNPRVGFQYQQPGEDPVKEKTLWSLGWQKEDTDTSESTSYLAEVSRITSLDSGWVFTRSLSFLNEEFEVADDSGTSTLLYPGVNLAKSRANDTRYPTRGWRLSGGLKGGVEKVLSDTTFTQATLDAKVIVPLFGGRIIGRTGLGATWVDNFAKLPASLRFFTGGDNSVRGFDYESLGPENDDGDVVGGKNLITGSIEYDHLVYKDYGAAVFYDTGTAFDTNQFTLHESAGFGLRWLSPIGPIRVDFAFPLKEGGFRLHLSMGPDL